MNATLLNEIPAWFSNLQDGEFVAFDSTFPYEFIAPTSDDGLVLYCTKPRSVLRALNPIMAAGMGMIGRPGPPELRDMAFLRGLMRRFPIVFLGDLDPPDLLIYAWMRSQLPDLRYFGIGDRLFEAAATTPNETILISLSSSERDATKTFPGVFDKMEGVVGPTCAEILKRGRKVEIEGAFSSLNAAWDDVLRLKVVDAMRDCAESSNR